METLKEFEEKYMHENQSCRYVAYCRISNKAYCGKAEVSFAKRKKRHLSSYKSKNEKERNRHKHFYRALRKYGEDAFYWIHEPWPVEDLNEGERLLIKEFDSFHNGYNMTEGGEGGKGYKHTEESKRKIGLASKGRRSTLGYKHSEESKKNMSIAQKGNKNGIGNKSRLGMKHSLISRNKMSDALKGHTKSEDHKRKLSEYKGEKHHGYGKHLSYDHRKKIGDAQKGEMSHSWKGGADRICHKCGKNKVYITKNGNDMGVCIECYRIKNKEYHIKNKRKKRQRIIDLLKIQLDKMRCT